MRKLLGAALALACLLSSAVAQQQPTYTADQGKPNTSMPWFVQVSSGTVTLGPGSAIIGRVGIDQGTPGTTNKVSIGSDGSVTANLGTLNGAATQATLATLNANTPTIGTQAKVGSRSVTPASDLSNLEPAGTPVTGWSMPAGGVGLTGWLSAVSQRLGTQAVFYPETTLTTSLANNSTTAGASRSMGGNPSPFTVFRTLARADQAVVLIVQGSDDAFATMTEIGKKTLTANTTDVTSWPILFTSQRAVIQNTSGSASAVTVRTATAVQ